MTVRFDDSLPIAARFVEQRFGPDVRAGSVFVRDASGRLSVLLDREISGEVLASASKELCVELGGYGRGPATIRDLASPGVSLIFEEIADTPPLKSGRDQVRLIDRRVVGADWLARPIPPKAHSLPRIVFASLKGGVGRSTALAVVSAHLSGAGKRVLAIDLDLEAPGIGSTLLRSEETPEFGVLDYLIENNISGVNAAFLQQCVGASTLGSRGARVDVMPALGSRTLMNPANALSKLGRVYIEDISELGDRISFSEQVAKMLDSYEATGRYDVVLIDARSGLHESNAAVLQNIDATVLLFASDQPQTYVGYKLLLAHLSANAAVGTHWFERFQFVQAKSSSDESRQRLTGDRLRLLLADSVGTGGQAPYVDDQNLTANDFDLDWINEDALGAEQDDIDEPEEVLRVLDDPRFEGFDPLSRSDLLTPGFYQTTFKSLLDFVDDLLIDRGADDPNG